MISNEKTSQFGVFLPASLMYFCSGQLMHLSFGVDIGACVGKLINAVSHHQTPIPSAHRPAEFQIVVLFGKVRYLLYKLCEQHSPDRWSAKSAPPPAACRGTARHRKLIATSRLLCQDD